MVANNKMGQKDVKCTVIGDGMVGKTTLALAFVDKKIPDFSNYVATVFDHFTGKICVHGEQYTVNLFDSPGQHDYENVRTVSYPECEVILICYSVVDRDSLTNVQDVWLPEVKRHVKHKKPIILVGCQCDLRTQRNIDHVTNTEGKQFADEIHADVFLECSSMQMQGVFDVFQHIVTLALRNRKRKSSIMHKLFRR